MDDSHPKNLRIADYSYALPEERIAQYPLDVRHKSRLLIYRESSISSDHYENLSKHLPEGSLLVLNDTRVIEARLIFTKPTGAQIEIFLLEAAAAENEGTYSINDSSHVKWHCLVGGAGKWKHGQVLSMEIDKLVLRAQVVAKNRNDFTIDFDWTPPSLSFTEVLHLAGSIPIPPYLKRPAEIIDAERYQTVYAKNQGSVAAPTAGLHFTKEVFDSLEKRGITRAYVTLHVGAGTFLPVKSSEMSGHTMHAEFLDVSQQTIEQLEANSGNILAVGTTALRTLESLYWMGVKALLNPQLSITDMPIRQWEVYEELAKSKVETTTALQALRTWMTNREMARIVTKTEILIAPPYQPKMVRGLITNFHQPHSTLLLLVAAVVGNDWKKIYDYALRNDFRFLSYGDGCLLYVH